MKTIFFIITIFAFTSIMAWGEPSNNRTDLLGPESPELKWSFQTDGSLHASPLIAPDGSLYVASTDGKLYKLDEAGNSVWVFDAGDSIFATPALTPDGNIIIGDLSGRVQSVSANGILNWLYRITDGTDNRILGGPVVSQNGDIFVCSWSDRLYVINSNGAEKWSATLRGLPSNSPVLDENDNVYIAYNNRGELTVKKFLASRDTARWTANMNTYNNNPRVTSSPAYDESLDLVIVGACRNDDGVVFAMSATNGRGGWNTILPKGITAKPAISQDGNVIVSCLDGKVYSLNATNGEIEWSFAVEGYFVMGSPLIDGNGIIYVGDSDGTLYALSPDGELIWQFHAGANIRSTPTVSNDGTLYLTSYNSTVYALHEPTAIKNWLNLAGD